MDSKTEVFYSHKDFLNRYNRNLNGVSHEFAEENENYIDDNKLYYGIWNGEGCDGCDDCLCRGNFHYEGVKDG